MPDPSLAAPPRSASAFSSPGVLGIGLPSFGGDSLPLLAPSLYQGSSSVRPPAPMSSNNKRARR